MVVRERLLVEYLPGVDQGTVLVRPVVPTTSARQSRPRFRRPSHGALPGPATLFEGAMSHTVARRRPVRPPVRPTPRLALPRPRADTPSTADRGTLGTAVTADGRKEVLRPGRGRLSRRTRRGGWVSAAPGTSHPPWSSPSPVGVSTGKGGWSGVPRLQSLL